MAGHGRLFGPMRGAGRLFPASSVPDPCLLAATTPPPSTTCHTPTLTLAVNCSSRVPLPAWGRGDAACNAPMWPSPPLPNQPSSFGRLTARPARMCWCSHVLAHPHCYNYTARGGAMASTCSSFPPVPCPHPMPAGSASAAREHTAHAAHTAHSSENGGKPTGTGGCCTQHCCGLVEEEGGNAVPSHPIPSLPLPHLPDITHIGPRPRGSHSSQGTPPSCLLGSLFLSLSSAVLLLLCCCAALNHIAFCDVQRFPARPGACAYIHTYYSIPILPLCARTAVSSLR